VKEILRYSKAFELKGLITDRRSEVHKGMFKKIKQNTEVNVGVM
jgi:hypothetical protein